MNKIILLFFTLTVSIIANAQTGTWSGELNVMGQKLPLVFNFSGNSCTMDSPKQGAKGIKTEWTPSDNGSVAITIPLIGASYEGKLNGKEITGNFKQSGMTFPLTLTQAEIEKLKRPQTPIAPFPYVTEEVTFKDGEVELHGTLSLPNGYTRDTPVVVMVTGSGQQNRDEEMFDHKPFAVIADAFARKGIATLRYDDRFWDNKNETFVNYTTYHLMNDALSAIELLRKRFNRVGVLGHSEGGTIALLLAEEGKADFVISMAGMVVEGKKCIAKQNEVMLGKVGVPEEMIHSYCKALDEGFNQIASGKKPEEIATPASLESSLATNFYSAMRQASNPWFLYFLKLDASKELSKISCPVLALNGKLDTQVDCKENLELLESKLKTKNKKIMALDNLNHLFQDCQTGLPTEYGEIEETLSSDVLDIMSAWIVETNR